MPELPEVEVICRGLQPLILGSTITKIQSSGMPLRANVDLQDMQDELLGQQIHSITRRAKYLCIKISNGGYLIIHLGMTGNIGLFPKDTRLKKHDHFCWLLDNGMEMRFNDSRRFGAIHLFPPQTARQDEKKFFSGIGPEPLGRTCTANYLQKRAKNRTLAIKAFIMDSKVMAGIGNIYANESLFRAKIHPAKPAFSLENKEWRILIRTIRNTLRHAIACGGSTISDYVNAAGEGGYFQINFQIYAKAGVACEKCGHIIEKINICGRTTFFCPSCQADKTYTSTTSPCSKTCTSEGQ